MQVVLTEGTCAMVGVPCVSALRRLVMAAGPVIAVGCLQGAGLAVIIGAVMAPELCVVPDMGPGG